MSKVAAPIILTSNDIKSLNNVIDNPLTSEEVRLRCRAIMLAGKGLANTEIADTLNIRKNTAGDWRKIWLNTGIDGILGIAKTGRPKSQRRQDVEALIKENGEESASSLQEKTGASKPTIYRTIAKNTENKHIVNVSFSTAAKEVDIAGLYISDFEGAIILMVSTETLHLGTGKMIADTSLPIEILRQYSDIQENVTLFTALDTITEHISELHVCKRVTGLQSYLSSVVPSITQNDNQEYYVIFYRTKEDEAKPVMIRSDMHVSSCPNRDSWIREVAFWISLLSGKEDLSDQFLRSTMSYIDARIPGVEPFQWIRSDIEPQNITVIEPQNPFDDPSVESVVEVTATIRNRDGTRSSVVYTENNSVPLASSLDYSSPLTAGTSIGNLDVNLGNIFRKSQQLLMTDYLKEAAKKNKKTPAIVR